MPTKPMSLHRQHLEPQTHMNAANAHGDGLVTVNGYAISPLKIGNAGDTRNVAESGALQAPVGIQLFNSVGRCKNLL